MKYGKLLSVISAVVISGCAMKPPITQQNTYGENDVLEIRVPVVHGESSKVKGAMDVIRGLDGSSYSRYYDRNGSRYLSSLKWDFSSDKFNVIRSACLYLQAQERCNVHNRVEVAISGNFDFTANADYIKLLIAPKTYNRLATRGMVTGKPDYENVDYKVSNLRKTISGTTYLWKFELNSPYSPESVYANFKRLSRTEAYSYEGRKDAVSGKIFKEDFWLKVGNSEVSLSLETYPYRDGSKIIIYSKIPPLVNGNEVDFIRNAEKVRKRVKEIINS